MTDEPPRKRMVRPPTGGDGGGRATPARLKTAKFRTPSSQAWLERQINDPRAAFKLSEIDDRFHILKKGARVIDLGCAPGGWLQVLVKRGAGPVAGVDLLPVEPLSPVHILEADFTDPKVGPELMALIGGAPDIVLSDMAPNTMGHRQTDHIRIVNLIEAAADFAISTLRPGGTFVTKAFQGGETGAVLDLLKRHFKTVRNVKPKASRAESSEVYIVAMGFKGSSAP
jgi:23S rRNA (uridine2552-2'-O)-methyltransferase